jgi:16S rRNA (uracil1498-N3)-methyltransferase
MLRRIFVKENIEKKVIKTEDKEILHRLKNVLRIKVGEEIILFNDMDGEFLCKVNSIGSGVIIFENLKKLNNCAEPELKINLYQAIIKKDKFEFLTEKAVETGVFSITPLITERTVKTNINILRLKKIAKEATEQSGRIYIPQIYEKTNFKDAIKKEKFSLLLHPRGEKHLKALIKEIKKLKEINIFIGPEGGFSDEEIQLAKECGVKIVNFGSRILRSETASAVIIGFILNY